MLCPLFASSQMDQVNLTSDLKTFSQLYGMAQTVYLEEQAFIDKIESMLLQIQEWRHVSVITKGVAEVRKEQKTVQLQAMENVLKELEEVMKRENIPTDAYKDWGDPDEQGKIPHGLEWPVGGAIDALSFDTACPTHLELKGTPSSGWIRPVADGMVSAGTWSYPQGGLHLGMDIAVPLYTPIVAPAEGVVLYASAPCEDASGYLGCWQGWPAGGGNTLALLVQVNDRVYAVTFFHLSTQIYVRAGQHVSQNDIIACSGNSGNSSGPHVHIEVFEILVSAQQAIDEFAKTADFSFQTGWETPNACSLIACQLRPESIWN